MSGWTSTDEPGYNCGMRRVALLLGMGLGRVVMLLWAAFIVLALVALGIDLFT